MAETLNPAAAAAAQTDADHVAVCCVVGADNPPASGRFFTTAGRAVGEARRGECCVLLAHAGAGTARALLAEGYGAVLVGDAALADAAVVDSLAREFGSHRVGVHLSVARLQVSWTMDVESNADFRFMRPTTPEPGWEILMSDGRRTGTLAHWWLGEMFGRGAGMALVEHPVDDDTDLNICAGLVERFGTRLWFAPREYRTGTRLADLLRWGRVRQLALAGRPDEDHPALVEWRAAHAPAAAADQRSAAA